MNKLPEDELDFDESEDDSDEDEDTVLDLVESEDNEDNQLFFLELQELTEDQCEFEDQEFEWFNVFGWFVWPVQALYLSCPLPVQELYWSWLEP